MAHEGYHEPYDKLPDSIRAMHRAISSLMEELEAVDWYYQRAAVTEDAELRAILLHNAHEEIEHAAMALEWIRRNDGKFDENLKKYLFKQGSIVGTEAVAMGRAAGADAALALGRAPARPTIGSMKRDDGGDQ